jgi:hypothetical protein
LAQPFVIDFNPNPVQQKFIMSQAQADLFSSRAGEGKSAGLAWSVFTHTRHNPGANWVMIRDTFENIQRSTMKEFFKWFPPGIAGEFNQTKKEFKWASGLADGSVSFTGMDNPEDASKLLSWELAGIALDEPAPAVGSAGIDEMVFDLGLTRLRQPGMKWYGMKLATNNPDESHWTFKKFVSDVPAGVDFRLHQPSQPENIHNLPEGYYENMRKALAHRPDLVRRFVDGEFGFQAEGKAVTPQWADKLHLATGLVAMPRRELILCWDFGLNPTCIVTQKSPMGYWLILESLVGDGLGVTELIGDAVKPLLAQRYRGHPLVHIGDPAGDQREQSSSLNRASRVIRKELGGLWHPGIQKFQPRKDALQAVLARTLEGRGVVQVDRDRAREVWYALRGGWHYHVSRTGITSGEPNKNIHSHPADAVSYGAAWLFPIGKLHAATGKPVGSLTGPSYWGYGQPEAPAQPWRIGPSAAPPELSDGDQLRRGESAGIVPFPLRTT